MSEDAQEDELELPSFSGHSSPSHRQMVRSNTGAATGPRTSLPSSSDLHYAGSDWNASKTDQVNEAQATAFEQSDSDADGSDTDESDTAQSGADGSDAPQSDDDEVDWKKTEWISRSPMLIVLMLHIFKHHISSPTRSDPWLVLHDFLTMT